MLRHQISLRQILVSTPFTDEVLENVGGQEAYSFMDGFSTYHQIKITYHESQRNGSRQRNHLLAQGQTQGSSPRAHQQSLAIGPFGSTCKADAISPEAAMRGLQKKDVYNQGNIKRVSQQHHNHHILVPS